MKIPRIIIAVLLAALLCACSGAKDEAKQAAERYAAEYILPLLPDAEIKEFENRLGQSQTSAVFVKGTEKRNEIAAEVSRANMDYAAKNDQYLGYRTESIVQNLKISG